MNESPYKQASYFDNMPMTVSVEMWQKTVNVIAKLLMPAVLGLCKQTLKALKLYLPVNSYLGVPLQWPDGGMFGTLCVLDRKEANYPESFIELMMQLKEIIDSDLSNILLIEKLRLTSITDELTNINNRRGFLENAERLIHLAKRHQLSLTLIYFDLNKLKSVNNAYGHEAGETEQTINSRIQQKFDCLTKNDKRIKNPSFSVGYKVYGQTEELVIGKMLSETDLLMYKNKKKQSQQNVEKSVHMLENTMLEARATITLPPSKILNFFYLFTI